MADEADQGTFLGSVKKFLNRLAFLAVLGAALWTWGALKFVYSAGERAGYVQKFSRKGWLFKTWEGELAMVNLPGTVPEIFSFTVRDDAVADRIRSNLGERVVILYNEHRGLPGNIFGDTRYFVIDARKPDGADPNGPRK